MTTKKAAPKERNIFERLADPFPPSCVEWRAQTVSKDGKQALALAYIDARSVMARLDEVLGPENWRDSLHVADKRTICTLELRINGEWIGKSDTSGDTNFEGEKGGASGALKRAAVKWGIGRYLYDVDAIWADCTSYKQRNSDKLAFKAWTDAGARMLAMALGAAPGPRVTSEPFAVQKILELIEGCKTRDELTKVREAHLEAVPLEYRKKVLEAGQAKRREIDAKNAPQPDEGTADMVEVREKEPPMKPPAEVRRQSRPPGRRR